MSLFDDGEDWAPRERQYDHEDAVCLATGRPCDDCEEECDCPVCRPEAHDPAELDAGRGDRRVA